MMFFAPVEEVSIYRTSAVVRRKTVIPLQAGVNEAVLSGISGTADPDSLRLSFSEGVLCTDIHLLPMKEAGESLPSEQINDEIEELQNRIDTLRSMEELWIANGNFSNRTEAANEAVTDYLTALPARLEELRARRKELNRQMEALRKKREKAAGKDDFQAVRVQLEASAAGEAECVMEYAESSARWNSTYEIHAETDAPEIRVIRRARIFQSTGEDWENVRVSLFTGNPASNQEIPLLKKTSLRFRPESDFSGAFAGAGMPGAPGAAAPRPWMQNAPMGQMNKTMILGANMQEAEELDAETVTGYALPGRRTVATGTTGTMADLKTDRIPARQCTVCIPKLNSNAYLAAAIRSSDWDLKPSSAKMYLNHNYCGEIRIAPDLTEETFLLSFGKDERFSVSRELTRSRKEEAALKGQKREIQEYAIRVSNNQDQPRAILVADQIPVPQEKQLTVDHISAEGASFNPETGMLSWNVTVAGKTTVETRFSYVITYPKDKTLQENTVPGGIHLKACPQCGAFNLGNRCSVCGSPQQQS